MAAMGRDRPLPNNEAPMSPTANKARQDGPEGTARVNKIVEIMRDLWDTPADCNDGELFTYAEILYDRIKAGESPALLDAYLVEVQTQKLQMPATDGHHEIVARATSVVRA
jgi:hypothetical protein